MPNTEAPAYTMLVAVDGVALPADVAGLLAGGFVDNSTNLPDMFVLHFADENGLVIDKAHLQIGAEVKVSVQPTGNEPPIDLLTAEITALETDVDSSGKHLVVRGLDKSHKLLRGTRVAAYVNMKLSDVVKKLAGQVGLGAGDIVATQLVHKHIVQPGISDWDFLTGLAATVGFEVSVTDSKLNFRPPVKSATAAGSTDSTQNAFVIEFGRNLVSLRATVTAAEQVPGVDVRGWDPLTKRAVVASASASTASATIDGMKPAGIAAKLNSARHTESNSTINNQQQAQSRADAIADRMGGAFAELDGVATGNPTLKAGKAVRLVNVGKNFDGKYTLTTTRHDFTAEGGYRTIFTVSNASDRSFYGVSTGAGGRAPVMSGALTAIVTSLNDPDKMGRVKVKIPVLADDLETWWARVVSPGAGSGRGVVWLPEVGDEVLVVFGMGNVDEPYVLGGLFNGKDKPDKSWDTHVANGQVQRRALVSRTGLFLELVETGSEEKIVISAGGGNQMITILQNGDKSIKIVANGPVNVTTKQDATVEAASGKITLKGTNVSVEATSALELKGATVKISAQASAELSGGASTAIKGGVVQIN